MSMERVLRDKGGEAVTTAGVAQFWAYSMQRGRSLTFSKEKKVPAGECVAIRHCGHSEYPEHGSDVVHHGLTRHKATCDSATVSKLRSAVSDVSGKHNWSQRFPTLTPPTPPTSPTEHASQALARVGPSTNYRGGSIHGRDLIVSRVPPLDRSEARSISPPLVRARCLGSRFKVQ